MTNLEKIKQEYAEAGVEEMAKKLLHGPPFWLGVCSKQKVCIENCDECVKSWLQQEYHQDDK